MFSTLEILLMPICFAFLFVLMLLYWGQTAFFSFIKYKKLTSFIFYLSLFSVTILLLVRWSNSGHLPLSNLYESLLFLSWSFLSIQAILQVNTLRITNGIESRSVTKPFFYNSNEATPPSNKIGLATELNTTKNKKNMTTLQDLDVEKQELLDLIAVIFSPISLLTYTFAFLNLPKEMQKATALVPALQSNWLMMHVSVMILSYAALLSGCLLAITYLLFNSINILPSKAIKVGVELPGVNQGQTSPSNQTAKLSEFWQTLLISTSLGSERTGFKDQVVSINRVSYEILDSFKNPNSNADAKQSLSEPRRGYPSDTFCYAKGENRSEARVFANPNSKAVRVLANPSKLDLSEKLDNYSYRLIGVGFPLLTIGILSGAVWANSAWGSYWSWDPKETWALITWLFFAIYLHARITRGWSGKKAAIIATIAFFVVWFCFLGVNLLGTGLHSYGWFNN